MSRPAAVRDLSSARVAPRPDAAVRVLTSESVSEGHPDKVCDAIADAILDAYLTLDRRSRVACEVLCKSGVVVLAGEISSVASLDHRNIVCDTVREIGYTDTDTPFSADSLQVLQIGRAHV